MPPLVADPSCILYLPLWKKDGATIKSDDRYGHTFTRAGPVWTPKGWLYDNVDDMLTGPTLAVAPVLNTAGIFSFIMWIKVPLPPTSTWRQLFYRRYGTPTNGWQFYADKDNGTNWCIFGRWVDNTPISIGMNIYSETWYCMAGTYDGVNMRTYRDAALQATIADARTILTDTPLIVGSKAGGYIGEACLFSTCLSLPEIRGYYDATKWRYL